MSDDSSSDSGPKDRNPPKKPTKSQKSQKEKKPEKETKGKKQSTEEGPAAKRTKHDKTEDNELVGGKLPLGSKKFVTVDEFRGKTFVNIREWYGDPTDLKPTKKGISLSAEQFEKLVQVAPKIREMLNAS